MKSGRGKKLRGNRKKAEREQKTKELEERRQQRQEELKQKREQSQQITLNSEHHTTSDIKLANKRLKSLQIPTHLAHGPKQLLAQAQANCMQRQ